MFTGLRTWFQIPDLPLTKGRDLGLPLKFSEPPLPNLINKGCNPVERAGRGEGSRNDGQVSHTAVAASPWGERKSGCTVYPTVGNAEGFAHVEKPSREQRCGQCPKGTDALHSSAAVAGRPLGSHRPGSTVHLRWGPESSLSGWRRLCGELRPQRTASTMAPDT